MLLGRGFEATLSTLQKPLNTLQNNTLKHCLPRGRKKDGTSQENLLDLFSRATGWKFSSMIGDKGVTQDNITPLLRCEGKSDELVTSTRFRFPKHLLSEWLFMKSSCVLVHSSVSVLLRFCKFRCVERINTVFYLQTTKKHRHH